LHNGHKLLLTESALLCDEKIVVGITDGVMIQNKVIYPVEIYLNYMFCLGPS
jgi:phosphopantetheine adenylyltransferase